MRRPACECGGAPHGICHEGPAGTGMRVRPGSRLGARLRICYVTRGLAS